jgi:thiol-disulfide isomerase/thioredoxin
MHDHERPHAVEEEASSPAKVLKSINIGDGVPDFDVTINGNQWKLSELRKDEELTRDGTLVFTFWCSFCYSCRLVESELDDLAKQYHRQIGVLALDASADETTEKVRAFAVERGLTLPIAISQDGTAADVFGVSKTTTTIIVDSQGVLRYRGQFSGAKDALHAVLAGEQVATPETKQIG